MNPLKMYFLVNMGKTSSNRYVRNYQRVYNILMYLSIVFYCLPKALAAAQAAELAARLRGLPKSENKGHKLFGEPLETSNRNSLFGDGLL